MLGETAISKIRMRIITAVRGTNVQRPTCNQRTQPPTRTHDNHTLIWPGHTSALRGVRAMPRTGSYAIVCASK